MVQQKIDELGRVFGWPWIPVKFHETAPSAPAQEKRFCEAIWDARATPVVLGAESMILLGVDELTPVQPALRRVGDLIRQLEEGGA